MANYRGGRINEEVKREISNIIQNEIKDPRLTAMVSVTDVKVTKDFIITNELAEKVNAKKFIIGKHMYKSAGYTLI